MRMPGRFRQWISDGSTASFNFGQRVNSACSAQIAFDTRELMTKAEMDAGAERRDAGSAAAQDRAVRDTRCACGSRLAAAIMAMILSPFFSCTPSSSTSWRT